MHFFHCLNEINYRNCRIIKHIIRYNICAEYLFCNMLDYYYNHLDNLMDFNCKHKIVRNFHILYYKDYF